MTKENALEQIQLMHKKRLISKESIVGWYSFYSNKLPKIKPERSSADLIRTIGIWMELPRHEHPHLGVVCNYAIISCLPQ